MYSTASSILAIKVELSFRSQILIGTKSSLQSNPLFRSPKGNEKKFEIAGLRNNRGSVKGKGKSKGIRSSFEIARFDFISLHFLQDWAI